MAKSTTGFIAFDELGKPDIQRVAGYECEVAEGIQTFVHRVWRKNMSAHYISDGWAVSERGTGMQIRTGDTRKAAIENARVAIEKHGLKKVLATIRLKNAEMGTTL